MTPEPTTLLCVICQRDYERPFVCEGDRASVPVTLEAIRGLWREVGRMDVAPTRRGEAVRVSGGNVDPAVPIALDVLDLSAGPNGYDHTTRPNAQDQIGHIPVETVLREWAREFRRWRGNTERMPGDKFVWLAERTDWACDAYPHVTKYVAAIRKLENTLRHITGNDRGDKVRIGWCPGTKTKRCGTELFGSVHQSSAECPRCGKRWPRITWLNLGAEGIAA